MDLSLVRLVLYLNLYVRKAHYIANFLNLRWSLSNIVLKIDIYLSISRPVYRYQESSNITLFTALDIAQYLCEYSWYSLILIKDSNTENYVFTSRFHLKSALSEDELLFLFCTEDSKLLQNFDWFKSYPLLNYSVCTWRQLLALVY